ncbi:amidohydrolase family protein [Flavobacterium sp. FlaQc-51]|uniref:amidohydrolase family protein n=1 Tax=Flavobacterium sp. FlaQc-51 TaxID=3374184 RepID=UPI003758019B
MNNNHRIDVHQHVLPPFWSEALNANGGDPSGPRSGDSNNSVVPKWSPEGAIALMDSLEISTSILSLTSPGIVGWASELQAGMARRINEYTAGLVAKKPLRFGNFATLPMPHIDESLAEIEYALDILHADGIILFSNYGDNYLGDAQFLPLWQELNRRKAVVFIHPGLPIMPMKGVAGPLVDYPFATTRVAVQLVLNGIVSRFPDVNIILSHAGGFVPYAVHRFVELAHVFRTDAPNHEEILNSFRKFYYDTALASSPTSLPSLTAFAKREHILFGSDYPFAPADVVTDFTRHLDKYQFMDQLQESEISHSNALVLFPRLSEQLFLKKV